MAEIRINATGGVKLYDADDSHYAQIIAGTITSNTDVMTLGHAAVVMGTKLDLNGNNLILDADADTYLDGGTADDVVDVYVAGAKDWKFGANSINVLSGTTLTIDSGATITNSGTATGFSSADPSSADGDTLGTASAEWSDLYLADGGQILFGNDQDTLLTHTDGTGLTLNSTNKLCFNDVSQFIQGSSATVISIGATDEIDLTATAVDLNGTLDVSGTSQLTGAVTIDSTLDAKGGAVFNEGSADVDFRVESNNNINTIFSDGGQAAVGINCIPTILSANGGSELSTSVYGFQATCAATGSGRIGLGANGTSNAYVTGAFPNSGGSTISLSRLEFEQTSNTAGSEESILELYSATSGAPVLRFAIAANGDLTATDTSISAFSDSRIKENIADYTYDVAKFKQLQPRTFDFKNPVQHSGVDNNRGFIAQEVQAVDDYWVSEKKLKEDNLDYDLLPDDKLALTSKLGKKDAMYISVINQLISRIEALEG